MRTILFLPIIGSIIAREVMANSAAAEVEREEAMANAADATIDAGGDDGWIKLAPYGTYPGSRPGRPQHFTEVEANAIAAGFGSIMGKARRWFKDVPVFIGHPDQNPQLYTDHRRLGKVTKLEARPDGLYGEIAWNTLGRENLEQGYWVYPSPRWDAPAGRPEFRPDRLISVGLTNMPRIAESEPVTNSQDFSETTTNNTETTTDMDRKKLTDELGLEVTATDEEIFAKIASMKTSAAEAATQTQRATDMSMERDTAANSLTESRATIARLEGEVKQAREAHANSIIEQAIESGRITKAESAEWLVKLTGDKREEEQNSLAALKPKLNTTSIDVSQSRLQIGNAAERRETIANAVDANMGKGMSYDEAYAAAKKDPALKPVWDAMNQADA